ncbi:MAG: sigma-70 family RNA polymerase sigma factor [Vicinamibacterales bacterium]
MPERSSNDLTSLVGRLYDQHGTALYRYALMLLADPAAAEDAVQQVFASMLSSGVATAIQHDREYLRQAVRNACYSMLRRRVTRAEVGDGTPLLEMVPGAGGSPDERVLLEQAMRGLTVDQREVVHLHVYEGLTFQEIATMQDASINTVAGRYRAALQRMRQHLSAKGERA